jgi:hypothetical protein
VKTLYLAAPLFCVTAMVAPAVAHADSLDDYVSRNGKAVCAALDKAQTGGDIFRLSLTIADSVSRTPRMSSGARPSPTARGTRRR